jgi:RNA methyltransferase, TrmH family
MLSKNQVKLISSLGAKKFRAEHGLFIAEGVKIVEELLRSSINVKQVFATGDWIAGYSSLPTAHLPAGAQPAHRQAGSQLIEVSESELAKISQLTTPNQVLAVAEIPSYELDIEKLEGKLTLVLDDIRDPGNLGTIIRIADWFGITDVICSESSVDAWNPKVVQATMGSIARVQVHYGDLQKIIPSVKIPVYGAVLGGDSIYEKELAREGLIVIGNESKGISPGVTDLLTDKLTIPNYSQNNPLGEAESLNAAIATAVICAEFRRS